MISNYFVATNYIYWGIKAILLAILVAFMFVLFTFKTEEFKYYLELIISDHHYQCNFTCNVASDRKKSKKKPYRIR